ncbi:MAG: lipopolysaccharide kinase InaA family protein [Flavobacteriaceae bacterium]|nr:lipopolysaccharide kinase InaA family protein [Flavobacteriaceae bacterium]
MHFKAVIADPYTAFEKQFFQVIEDFDALGEKIGRGKRNTVKAIDLGALQVNVKSFKVPHFINQLVYRWLRKSKARRSYEYANLLLSKGIGTPKPLAYFENSGLFSLKDSYYFSEQLLHDLTYRTLVLEPDYPDHENILRQFTRFTYEMQEKKVYFKDHSPGNTLIVNNKGSYSFYLVDLNRMEFKHMNFEERMKNFDRLSPKKEMVAIMSDEYAKLSKLDPAKVFERMWHYTLEFQNRHERKKDFKKKYLRK